MTPCDNSIPHIIRPLVNFTTGLHENYANLLPDMKAKI